MLDCAFYGLSPLDSESEYMFATVHYFRHFCRTPWTGNWALNVNKAKNYA
jgi:hypothetical protein